MGGTIKSESAMAASIAREMHAASDAITQATSSSVAYANQTTLTVNSEAQTVNDEMKHIAISFNAAFLKTIENLQSVEEGFTKTDEELKTNIGGGMYYSIE